MFSPSFYAELLQYPPKPFFSYSHTVGTKLLPDSRPAVFAFAGSMPDSDENKLRFIFNAPVSLPC